MAAAAENPRSAASIAPSKHSQSSNSKIPSIPRPQLFSSYHDNANISPSVKIFFEIISKIPVPELEAALSHTGIPPLPEHVEEVLKFCYGSPAAAVKFFRWAGLTKKHTTYSWNLMVDILGKNQLFEEMWDAIRSMKQEGVLSIATFVSVFGSYCNANKISEAVMTFDVMDRYGIQPDVVAVNSLLSAICREDNQTLKALEFFERTKTKIAPDGDTFAILLEGWEKEGNVAKAKTTFGEMVIRVGWSPQNMSAYDAFLTTLVRGAQADEAIKFLMVMKGKNCLPGMKFFSNALDILIRQKNHCHAVALWDIMVGSGLVPNLIMYNAMIGLLCDSNDFVNAFRFLDNMVFHGAFPDSLSYNMIFQCLIKIKKGREAASFFFEMTKNEWPPSHSNCASAIKLFFDCDDPESAIEVWSYMIKNHVSPVDESSNALLVGLIDLGRVKEVRRFADDMLDGGINISESTMAKLKSAFYKDGRSGRDMYDRIARRWKDH
ncbi:pentatricopeptide repeat-containing protein At1g77360, mitochondrial-like [Telopea speciosissima]|uniref:pentatricopeptide repeat-containing protein At1g77360, mitochondrial-like n=1 Tax=Telopea speciosissima TaxID=54955 RepID=UPI001CC71108|nr:pentatricopeptide repeat-containing protein At1g77360, mitochondrial-like [Telopea speciosissima]